MSLFPGFTQRRIRVPGATINLVSAGSGPAVLAHAEDVRVDQHGVRTRVLTLVPDAPACPIAGADVGTRRAVQHPVRQRSQREGFEGFLQAGDIDLAHNRADRGRKIDMPVHVLWGARGVIGQQFDCLADWREVAQHVSGKALDCGHFIPEEASAETLAEIQQFLRSHAATPEALSRPSAGAIRPIGRIDK